MVEIYFRARRRFLHRIRHRVNTVLASHPPLLFFSKYDVKISWAAHTHVARQRRRRQRHRFSRFSLSSHLSYAVEGCYVNVKLCID